MKSMFLISILFLSPALWAIDLKSSVPGISIGNTHQVTERILRGKSPDGKVSQLVKKKVTDVIIFKVQSTNEIDLEIKELEKYKYRQKESIHYIPLQWKNLPPFEKSCEQTLEALQILKAVNDDSSRKAFFHCTVGQDRTGMLAGLWKMLLLEQSSDFVFNYEMCAHGYEGASPGKPESVIRGVKDGLTKIFIKISYFIETKKIDIQNINSSICSYDFSSDESYLNYLEEKLPKFTCPLNANLK